MSDVYPIQLNLTDKHVVIIGGGQIAWRKLSKLKAEHCTIDVVSQTFNSEFRSVHWPNHIRCIEKSYEPSDIQGADLIIIATDDGAVNDRVCADAAPYQWVNHTGDRRQSDFYNMVTVHHDGITFNISSNGKSIHKAQKYATRVKAFLETMEEDING